MGKISLLFLCHVKYLELTWWVLGFNSSPVARRIMRELRDSGSILLVCPRRASTRAARRRRAAWPR